EAQAPNVIIELLSESTATNDKTEKKQVYQNKVRVPEYFWYDPFNPEDLAGFNLQNGVYQPISEDQQKRLMSQQLGLLLVRWQGCYKDVEATWLRWATLEGDLIPTPQEEAQQAKQQAAQAQQEAAQVQQEAEQVQQEAAQAQQEAEQAQQEAAQAQQEAEQVQQEAAQAQQEAAQAQQRAEQLAARLRAMGVNPDDI
ncbi:MAG: Uma2 family endonuclease, partial [Symploca sp. SIO2G7]|nr:Uma2 family endonuclease [Symploca sp. SIO2G7]